MISNLNYWQRQSQDMHYDYYDKGVVDVADIIEGVFDHLDIALTQEQSFRLREYYRDEIKSSMNSNCIGSF